MILKLGIGIATYNRREMALAAARRVIAHTQHPFALVLADDGSSDATAAIAREQRISVVGGRNMGTAWNKNRALFYLGEVLQCDIVILLEDDTFPVRDGWERAWMIGAGRYGAVQLTPKDEETSGESEADGPVSVSAIRSQCAAFAREALLFGGYMDSRMQGCGWENIEHAQRLHRAGYGVGARRGAGGGATYLALPPDGLRIRTPASHVTEDAVRRNRELAAEAMKRPVRLALPWHDEGAMRQFRAEMGESAPRIARQFSEEQLVEESSEQDARRPPALEIVASAHRDEPADVPTDEPERPQRRARRRANG
jgi:hypothetical protein